MRGAGRTVIVAVLALAMASLSAPAALAHTHAHAAHPKRHAHHSRVRHHRGHHHAAARGRIVLPPATRVSSVPPNGPGGDVTGDGHGHWQVIDYGAPGA